MEKEIQKNKHILTELEVSQLKEQRNKIITNAAFMSAGIVDLAILKMFSNNLSLICYYFTIYCFSLL